MRQIRKSVFETNSSSTHSLVILKDDLMGVKEGWCSGEYLKDTFDENNIFSVFHKAKDLSYFDENKQIYYVRFGQFGWDMFLCNDFDTKLSYYLTCELHTNGITLEDNDSIDILDEKTKNKIESIIKKKYGENIDIEYRYGEYTYVDHTEYYLDMISKIENDLEVFLNDDTKVICGGNDNLG